MGRTDSLPPFSLYLKTGYLRRSRSDDILLYCEILDGMFCSSTVTTFCQMIGMIMNQMMEQMLLLYYLIPNRVLK